MITTMIIVTVLATVILVFNPKDLSFIWLSIAIFMVGFMILAFLLDQRYPDAPHVWVNTMIFIGDVAVAYSFGMFGVVYSELYNRKNRLRLMAIGLILIMITWMLTPLSPTRRINYAEYNEWPVVLFVTVCMTCSIVLLIIAYIRENHPHKKRDRLFTNLLIVPVMLWLIGSYMLYINEIDIFQFNYILAIAFVIEFFVLGIKKGALGVKIRIEMLRADASMHVLKGSSSLLSHTIKNEVGKVDILLHQIQQNIQSYPRTNSIHDHEAIEMIAMATNSVQHIQTMMTKINEQTQAIVVNLRKENLLRMLEQCLGTLEKTIKHDITIVRKFESVHDVYLDPVHMKEVIMNILSNAVESMADQGVITVSLTETNKEVVLLIQDSGRGIPKEALFSVFNPFYSTKKMNNHYGLGLYYCMNVMKMHNGSIYVKSVQGKGSSFYLYLQK